VLPRLSFGFVSAFPSENHPGVKTDYICLLGQGLLSKEDYITLKDALEAASLSHADFQKVLVVESISLVNLNTGQQLNYTQTDFSRGPGYAFCKYDVGPDFSSDVDRNNKFELTISTYGRRKHGWYSYCARRTITGGLDLEVLAPFEIRCHAALWWCSAERTEEQLTSKQFSSRISIPGPVPVGTMVTWTFHP
jgi:hypothetical protein